jgi:hypothetical protein
LKRASKITLILKIKIKRIISLLGNKAIKSRGGFVSTSWVEELDKPEKEVRIKAR